MEAIRTRYRIFYPSHKTRRSLSTACREPFSEFVILSCVVLINIWRGGVSLIRMHCLDIFPILLLSRVLPIFVHYNVSITRFQYGSTLSHRFAFISRTGCSSRKMTFFHCGQNRSAVTILQCIYHRQGWVHRGCLTTAKFPRGSEQKSPCFSGLPKAWTPRSSSPTCSFPMQTWATRGE